jgi:hypothetical protein
MLSQLTELLHRVEVSEPHEAGGLQVFGLRAESESRLAYVTLDEALAARVLDVAEVTESGSVPAVQVVNRASAMVLLLAGEHLVGAKQNRVLNASIMVGQRSSLPVPVSCVEAGRWSHGSLTFSSGGTLSHSALRRLLSRHVHDGYRHQGRPISKQSEVWDEVSGKLARMGTMSDSCALQQTYVDYQDSLAAFLERLPVPRNALGVAFALRGKVAGADLFDKPATLVKLWPKLVRSYAIDALETDLSAARRIAANDVRQWLRAVKRAKTQPFRSPGLGCDIRLEAEGLVGAALVVEDQPVHLELFAQDGPTCESEFSSRKQ